MTFTYNVATLATNTVHQVRFYTGDTVTPGHAFEDEEIAFVAADSPNACMAAVEMIRRNIPRLAASSGLSRSIGDLSVSYGDGGAQFWASFADNLEEHCRVRQSLPLDISWGSDSLESRGPILPVGLFDDRQAGGDPRVDYSETSPFWQT